MTCHNKCLELANNKIVQVTFDGVKENAPEYNDLIKMIQSQKEQQEYDIYILDGINRDNEDHDTL